MAITEPADPRANATSTGGGWGDLDDFDKALESKGFTSVHLKVGCKKAVVRAGRAWCREAGGGRWPRRRLTTLSLPVTMGLGRGRARSGGERELFPGRVLR